MKMIFKNATCVIALIVTNAFPPISHAGITGQDIQSIANVALGTYGSFLGQKQMMIQQQIASQKNAALMQKLSPSCRNTDGTFCYQSSGKYFPECSLPASMATMPQNVCSETIPDATQSGIQISNMITYESIAKGWVNYYDQMSNEATNSISPPGLKCLIDKKKKLDSELIEMVNSLTRLQDQLNKDKEIFKANNKKLMEQLSQANDELMGASKNNLAIKTNAFAKYFSSSCQSVIGEEGLAKGSQVGLLAIQQLIAPANKRAADYNQNRNSIEAEVRTDISKIQNSITTSGLQDYFDGKITETSKYKSLVVATQKQSAEFKLAKDRISKELSKIGYDLPTMDKNFSIDFDEFLSGSTSFFKKSYINDCVTGADRSGVAISTEQVLGALQQQSTNSSGTARDKYRAALRNILDSDSFIEDKLAKIRVLENTYKDISITYQSSNGQRVTETPYDLYVRTLAKCEQRYAQDDTFSANGANGVSQKKKVERGQSLLRELKSLHDNYSSNLASKVLDQVLSCNGETKKSGSTCGTLESFDHTAESFCISHASHCANEVNGCYAEATNFVEDRKAKITSLAKTFNANSEELVKRSNLLYSSQKNAVMDMIKIIQTRFPGTNFPIPENMFISMPELKKDTYGVDLVNDGNLGFMDELPKKIDLLKKLFSQQQAKMDNEIDDYISKQKQAMNTNKEKWQVLGDQCKSHIASVTKDLAKYNSEGQKRQAEEDQRVGLYCRKYSNMIENPLGACDDVQDLASDADKIAARLTNGALKYTGKFQNICNMYNNESTRLPEKCEEDYTDLSAADKRYCRAYEKKIAKELEDESKPSSTVKRLNFNSICKSGGNLNDDKKFLEAVYKILPSEEAEAVEGFKTVKDIEENLDKLGDVAYDFFSSVRSVALIPDKPVCDQLAAYNNATDRVKTSELEVKKMKDEHNAKREELIKAHSFDRKLYEDEASFNDAKEKIIKDSSEKLELALKPFNLPPDDYKKKEQILKDAIVGLVPVISSDNEKRKLLTNLGEQAEVSCDSQLTATTSGKNMTNTLLDSFDRAILGTGK